MYTVKSQIIYPCPQANSCQIDDNYF